MDNRLVVVRIFGELLSGNTSDIDTIGIRKYLTDKNAISPQINRNKLTTKELKNVRVSDGDKSDIEKRLFEENIVNIRSENKLLQNEKGIIMANELLKILKKSPIEGAKESTALKNKITREAIETLEISEMVEE